MSANKQILFHAICVLVQVAEWRFEKIVWHLAGIKRAFKQQVGQ